MILIWGGILVGSIIIGAVLGSILVFIDYWTHRK